MTDTAKGEEIVMFADPYKVCDVCKGWVTGADLSHVGPQRLIPCGHHRYSDVCPSWGPVDGCQCLRILGYVPHAEPPARPKSEAPDVR